MSNEIRFGDWRFCPETRSLTRAGRTTRLEPRVASLLGCFLAHAGEVLSHDQLVDEVWDGRAVSDEAVRRAVSSLRHALADGTSERPIRTLHKKGYIADFAGDRTFVPGEGPTPPPPAAPAATHLRPAWLGALGLLLLAAGLAGWWLLQRADPATPGLASAPSHTLAVLPFVDMSPGRNNRYFSDGLADELRDRLARVESLRVTARSSSSRFRDSPPDPREVGRALQVDYLVEGSVRREGDRVRIGVSLVSAGDGFQLWSEQYDRTLADFFAVQEEIATQVTRTLRLLLVQAQAPREATGNPEALLAYLRGRALLSSWGREDALEAANYFERAIALDPEYASAYIQLVDAKTIVASDRGGMTGAEEDELRRLVTRALALDPDLAEAYAARAGLAGDEGAPTEQWEADLRQAIRLNPSYSPAYERLAIGMALRGRFDEAFRLIDQAIAIDPLRPRNTHVKGMLHFWQGDLDAAEALERATLRLQPDYYNAYLRLGYISLFRGNYAQAVLHLQQALAISPHSGYLHNWLAYSYLCAGDIDRARKEVPDGDLAVIPLALIQFTGDYPAPDALLRNGFADSKQLLLSDVILAGALAGGDYAHAWAQYQANFDTGKAFVPGVDSWSMLGVYLDIALSRYLLRGDEASLAAVETLRQQVPADPVPHQGLEADLLNRNDAVAAAVLGERERALDALRRLLGSGHSHWWWWARTHPAFAALRDAPEFQAWQAANEEHARQQNLLLEQMRRDGRLPVRG